MKCVACGNDVSHFRSFETTDKSLCPRCHDAGDIWAAKQSMTDDNDPPRSQVEKLTPKAGDLIVLRVPADCAQPSEASMAKFADAFPGVRFLFLPIAEEPYSFTEQLGELRHTVTFKTNSELKAHLERAGVYSKQKDDSQVDLIAEMERTGRLLQAEKAERLNNERISQEDAAKPADQCRPFSNDALLAMVNEMDSVFKSVGDGGLMCGLPNKSPLRPQPPLSSGPSATKRSLMGNAIVASGLGTG